MEQTEIIKLNSDDSVQKFEAIKKSVEDQLQTLKLIQVTDETSLAIANQQLSASKTIENLIEAKRVEIKAPALAFGKQVDTLAKTLVDPLKVEVVALKERMLTYSNAEQARKQKELDAIAEKQKEIQQRAKKFFDEATAKIHSAKNEIQLSDAYIIFIKSYPEEYGPELREQLKKLGIAKQKSLKGLPNADNDYTVLYNQYMGIEAPTPTPVFAALEEKKVELQLSTPGLNTRKTWDFEVADEKAIPRDWLILNPDAVKNYIAANKESLKDGVVINGVKFIQKVTVVTK